MRRGAPCPVSQFQPLGTTMGYVSATMPPPQISVAAGNVFLWLVGHPELSLAASKWKPVEVR